jgi:hypothetical protein
MPTLPLWIVTEHIQPSGPKLTSKSEPGAALAFTSSDKLFKFVRANLAGEWKIQMAADRDGLVILIADLHRLAIEIFALDPAHNATSGEQVTLTELMDFADSLR